MGPISPPPPDGVAEYLGTDRPARGALRTFSASSFSAIAIPRNDVARTDCRLEELLGAVVSKEAPRQPIAARLDCRFPRKAGASLTLGVSLGR